MVDFGTSSSLAALVAGDDVRLVPEPITGSYTWPSAVLWDGRHMYVGSIAERRKRAEPTAYAAEFNAASPPTSRCRSATAASARSNRSSRCS